MIDRYQFHTDKYVGPEDLPARINVFQIVGNQIVLHTDRVLLMAHTMTFEAVVQDPARLVVEIETADGTVRRYNSDPHDEEVFLDAFRKLA